ncbi:MAG: adenylosuccinate lyase [Nanoarchaeota archaeon]|nr:adenylosuccinate lyase [Nanoarchaeota archaeon]MBU1632001.1 adenylosuccinate lyase [Nanoarchaeota archaeon]MBU1875616.1 adenylosuccinate lyase [Nanoarchaeota archaeon]
MHHLEAISPVDGRYRKHTEPLADIFSEKGLIRNRVKVEGEYLLSLSEHPQIGTREFSGEEKDLIRRLYDVSTEDAGVVNAIEVKGHGNIKATNHDVKAVEYFMKEKLRGTSLEDSLEWIHFALTSEDVNNLAYGLMLSDGVGEVVLPSVEELYETIEGLAKQYKDIPMLARTHGQPASPTTFGKEFKVFASRLRRQLDQLGAYEILVKLNGATGNYDAHHVAYPQVDWIEFTRDFVERFNDGRKVRLKPNFVTTQIEPHDTYAELFDNLRRLNTVLIGFDQDMWRYISDDWIKQKPVEGEVGSSTMPHKVNPIDFENSEGNLGLANVLFGYFSSKLPVSRLQRDLSDSTVERNFGVALGHSLIGYKSAQKGLSKIAVNEQKVVEELENHPEIISEAIQTVLRRERAEMPYERLKELTRGRKPTMDNFRIFIDGLDVSQKVKEELSQISPTNYTGIARLLVESQ